MNLINIRSLKKSYNTGKSNEQIIFNGLNLKIRKGSLVAVVGKNGSGKTTFLKCITGLCDFEEGEIDVNLDGIKYVLKPGNNIDRSFRKKIGVISQKASLWPHFNLLENVMNPLKHIHGKDKDEAKHKAIIELDDIFGVRSKEQANVDQFENYESDMIDFYKKYPEELSGGEYKRVALARTFAIDPEVLILDEFEANLDPWIVEDLLRYIEVKYVNDPNKTVLMVTHRTDLLLRLASSVIVFKKERDVVYVERYNSLNSILEQGDYKMIDWLDTKRNPAYVSDQALRVSKKIIEEAFIKRNDKTYQQILTNSISDFIKKIDYKYPHLVMLVTKKNNNLLISGISCWEPKSEKFCFNGKDIGKLENILDVILDDKKTDRKEYELKEFGEMKGTIKQGIPLDENGSLISLMFKDGNSKNFQYVYKPYDPIKEVYHEPKEQFGRVPYMELSKGTQNVYLFPMKNENGKINGLISIDTFSKSKWLPFVIKRIQLIANIGAISLHNN